MSRCISVLCLICAIIAATSAQGVQLQGIVPQGNTKSHNIKEIVIFISEVKSTLSPAPSPPQNIVLIKKIISKTTRIS